jgi:HEAT repeat protein
MMKIQRNLLRWPAAVAMVLTLVGWGLPALGAGQAEYLAVLKSDAPLSEKARACEALAVVGGDEAVAVLAPLLGDEPLGDYARFALEPIPGATADAAFRAALDKLDGRLLAGVVNSIGVRGDVKAVPKLSAMARDVGSGVRSEAIAALGRIATDEAIDTITSILKAGPATLRPVAAEACLVAADRLAGRGRTSEAAALCRAVADAEVPRHLQAAGAYGAMVAGGQTGVDLLIEQLGGNDPWRLKAALRAARQLPGEQVTARLVEQMKAAGPPLQVLLIGVLADRGDATAYATVKEMAAGKDPTVQLKAVQTLGEIGDKSAVPLLASRVGGEGRQAEAAAASLRQLDAAGVDDAIVEALKTAQGHGQAVLIDILTSRAATQAKPALLAAAQSADADVAAAAFKGLTVLADGEDTQALVALLVDLKTEAPRRYAENAVVAAADRIAEKDARADAVLQKLTSAQTVSARASLLRVLGRIANAKAFEAIDNAAEAQNPTIRDIAIRALAAWPDARALDRLAALSHNSSNATYRVLALRGYVRLLGIDARLSDADRLAGYKEAMDLAPDAGDRKLVLAALANARHPDALPIAMACVDEPQVRNEAILAALTIAQATAGARPNQARQAALKLAQAAGAGPLQDQARTLADTIGRFDDFIVGWQVAGPYMRDGTGYQQLFRTPLGPEAGDGDAAWSVMPAATDPKRPWVLDLLKLWPGEQRVAYARTWVKSDRPCQAVLETGSDDGIKVWLNGELVQSIDAARAAVPASEKATIHLKAGWNRLMVKVTQNVLGWEFCVRIVGADGAKLDGLDVDCLHENSGAVSVFDGRSFEGWEGNMRLFRISDGRDESKTDGHAAAAAGRTDQSASAGGDREDSCVAGSG